MTRKEKEKRIIVEEAREDRKFLTEVDRVQEERERSKILEKKCEHVKKMRQERLILEKMREVCRQKKRKAEEKKQLKDLEYLKEIEERSKKMSRLRQEQIEIRERVLETTRIMLDAQIRKRKKEKQLIDLVAEEIRCELVIREMEEAMHRKKMQQELAAILRVQIIFTEQCKLHFVEKDRAWGEKVITKIMEDEKTARYTAEAKRRMKIQYRKDLESLIAHRHKIREEEITRIKEIAKEQQRLEQVEAECAKEERKRLLMIHAANIANFVNRTTLTVEEQKILHELTNTNRNIENIDNKIAKN